MFLAIGGTLGVLWMLGMLYGYRMGGAIYILLAAAIVMVFLGLRQWWRQPA
ncbi:MAG TPA: lmo0937 family membrane protein [Verrucomicrobiae bacterium]|nr:lmo0937 family membrane protein [Verrucomicrobiae bacterium]